MSRRPGPRDRRRRALRGLHPLALPALGDEEPAALDLRRRVPARPQRGPRRRSVVDGDAVPRRGLRRGGDRRAGALPARRRAARLPLAGDGLEPVDELDGRRRAPPVPGRRRPSARSRSPPGLRARRSRSRSRSRSPPAASRGAPRRRLGAPAGAIVAQLARAPRRGARPRRAPRAGLHRVTVTSRTRRPYEAGTREEALKQTFCSTHTVLRARGGEFVSLTDPPEALRHAAEECANEGAWPVLVGDPRRRSTLLSSPIILPDYPRVAPRALATSSTAARSTSS